MKYKVFIIILAFLVMLCGCSTSSTQQETINLVANRKQTFWEYLTDTKKSTKIMYVTENDNFGKDSIVKAFYLFKDGKCRKYVDVPVEYCNEYGRCEITLGVLSKMTDEEIIAMLEQSYQEKHEKALQFWLDYVPSETAAYPYVPSYDDFMTYLETDNTGNNIVGEVVILPVAGIGDNPYTIYIPSDNEYGISMDVYEASIDKSYGDTRLHREYFSTGYGYKSDFNKINDCYYFNDSNCFSGVVYNSKYLCFNTLSSAWTNGYYTVFFRDENADKLQISFDSLSSSNIDYIDPTEEDIKRISNWYYNIYYNKFASESLTSVKEITNNDELRMPNLIGMTWEEASKRYADSEILDLIPQLEWNAEQSEGVIFYQELPEGRTIKKGSQVIVKVSKGIQKREIQDMTNRTYEAAKKQLEKDGFMVTLVRKENDTIAKDNVISTIPEAHSMAEVGSTVIVIVSMGHNDKPFSVPKLVDMKIEDALKRCEEYGLVPQVDYMDSLTEKGTVLEQSIKENTMAYKGDKIVLTVSSGELS